MPCLLGTAPCMFLPRPIAGTWSAVRSGGGRGALAGLAFPSPAGAVLQDAICVALVSGLWLFPLGGALIPWGRSL